MRHYIDIVEATLYNNSDTMHTILDESMIEEAMQTGILHRKPEAMGLETMYGDGFALSGGIRVGSSPAGMMRLGYTIIDIEAYKASGGDYKSSDVGFVHLMIADGTSDILGMINIKILPKKRKGGIGVAVVQSLVQTAPGDFVLWDIQRVAVGFWQKMGAEFYMTSGTPVEKPKAYKSNTLMGVIRKPGSTVPVNDLPGFRRITPS